MEAGVKPSEDNVTPAVGATVALAGLLVVMMVFSDATIINTMDVKTITTNTVNASLSAKLALFHKPVAALLFGTIGNGLIWLGEESREIDELGLGLSFLVISVTSFGLF